MISVMVGLGKGGVAYLADLVELGHQAVPGLSGRKILTLGGRLCLNIVYNKKQWRMNLIALGTVENQSDFSKSSVFVGLEWGY